MLCKLALQLSLSKQNRSWHMTFSSPGIIACWSGHYFFWVVIFSYSAVPFTKETTGFCVVQLQRSQKCSHRYARIIIILDIFHKIVHSLMKKVCYWNWKGFAFFMKNHSFKNWLLALLYATNYGHSWGRPHHYSTPNCLPDEIMSSVVGWGTMLQAGRSQVRDPMRSLNVFSLPNLSSCTRPWCLLSLT
jgi:hypothetical protein